MRSAAGRAFAVLRVNCGCDMSDKSTVGLYSLLSENQKKAIYIVEIKSIFGI
jgi:hypothetical protein